MLLASSLLASSSSPRGGGDVGGDDNGDVYDTDDGGRAIDSIDGDDGEDGGDSLPHREEGAAPAALVGGRSGGDLTRDGAADDDHDDDDDDERYSRQMYTLGARAHRLVRSATAVLDGPTGGSSRGGGDNSGTMTAPSGLLYKIAKILALSGVGRIVLVGEDDDDGDYDHVDVGYFDGSLDDLGAAYRRAALAEVGGGVVGEEGGGDGDVVGADDGDGIVDGRTGFRDDDGASLLAEYIRRLNPGVRVDVVSRTALMTSLRGREEESCDREEEGRSRKRERWIGR